jgi:hypothetical protein
MFRALRRGTLIVALAAGVSPAQSVDPRLEARLDARTRAGVSAIVDSARLVGLPTEPLILKALEGAAKRAPGPRIVSAVRDFATQLGTARKALGPNSSDDEIIGGASALRMGIPVRQLESLRGVRPGVRLTGAFNVLVNLVANEVPADTAVSVMTALVRAGASNEQLLAIGQDIETDIRAGKPAAAAASIRGQALEQTLAASGPPNGAGAPGTLPSPLGTNRAGGEGGVGPQSVGAANASRGITPSTVDAPSRPPVPPRGKPKKRP